MNVLVCDDDAAARFVATRWLTKTLGCAVTSCEDGVEALKRLSDTPFDLAIIDLDLPRLSGVEVVEAIRASEATRGLPVVILSQERREAVILQLMALGVSAYLLKPLRERTVLGRIAPLLALRRASRVRPGGLGDVRLGVELPALLVDGDPAFREAFSGVAAEHGPIVTAESGADAVSVFRTRPVDLVFVGAALGIVGPDALVRKLREAVAGPIRIVGIGVREDSEHRALFDDVMPRELEPQSLADALHPFVVARPALADVP